MVQEEELSQKPSLSGHRSDVIPSSEREPNIQDQTEPSHVVGSRRCRGPGPGPVKLLPARGLAAFDVRPCPALLNRPSHKRQRCHRLSFRILKPHNGRAASGE
ncbi:hypothetical protein EYF80_065092 [Liparis tanakae]|uniref:Uncharacterized protein n=1 Tax=Liparis tanakae TaxID=230148 RepID=A0A4Z2E8Z6_9TELE|nr:hypothetical protein EYF80_065092 [Liparis tanakae]